MSESESRLDSLFRLLESKNAVIQKEAIQTLRDIQRSHPDELVPLLLRLIDYLFKAAWNSRISASQALAEILSPALDHHASTSGSNIAEDVKQDCKFLLAYSATQTLVTLDFERIIRTRPTLEKEEETQIQPDVLSNGSSGQRQEVDRKLGVLPGTGVNTKDWYNDDDLVIETLEPRRKKQKLEEDSSRLQLSPQQMKDIDDFSTLFRFLAAYFCQCLSDKSWTNRHGASLGLKSLLSVCGRLIPGKELELILCETLAVMALDRFTDFVAGKGVAPVRESCSQVVALLYQQLDCSLTRKDLVQKVAALLDHKDSWECRQSALLCLKYMLAMEGPTAPKTANSTSDSALIETFKIPLMKSIEDNVDEVSSGATDALLPVASRVADWWSTPEAWSSLWKHLHTQAAHPDSSAEGLLSMLSEVLKQRPKLLDDPEALTLISLLDSQSSQVRLKTFESIVQCLSTEGQAYSLLDSTVQLIFRALYRRILLESIDSSTGLSSKISDKWPDLLDRIGQQRVITCICPFVGVWIGCLMVSELQPAIDSNLLSLATTDGAEQETNGNSDLVGKSYIGGAEIMAASEEKKTSVVIDRKLAAAKVLASCFKWISRCTEPMQNEESPSESLFLLLRLHLQGQGNSIVQRTPILLTLSQWSSIETHATPECAGACAPLFPHVQSFLTDPSSFYDETAMRLAEVSRLAKEYLDLLRTSKISVPTTLQGKSASEILQFCRASRTGNCGNGTRMTANIIESLDRIESQLEAGKEAIQTSHRRYLALVASALIGWNHLPQKFNPIVRPLMEAIKGEKEVSLVNSAAESLAKLLEHARQRTPCPNEKIVRNLVSYHASDKSMTPDCDKEASAQSVSIFSLCTENPEAESAILARNAGIALCHIATRFSDELKSILPQFWKSLIEEPLKEDAKKEETIASLQVVETVFPSLSESLQRELIVVKTPLMLEYLSSSSPGLRNLAARVLAEMARSDLPGLLNSTFESCIEKANSIEDPSSRAGASEYFYFLQKKLGSGIIGALALLAPPTMARMSDHMNPIRELSSITFAEIMKLMPLENQRKTIPKLSPSLELLKSKSQDFITLLTTPQNLAELKLPVNLVSVELRPYQIEGITWLWFLNQYHLHGILSDDMGLGKTLQSLCVLATSHHGVWKRKKSKPAKSLIICPRTLVTHWGNEIHRYFGAEETRTFLRPLAISSNVELEESNIKDASVIITSYDLLRRRIDVFSKQHWHYCILDEGHVIRNSKTQMFKAITELKAEHRLILSGTPVQNSVLELWSLFHFLMPGYLGSQSSFAAQYSKPILASRDAAASSVQSRAGEAALESLHKQILPFILRRQKADVLKDLPPKLIQDRFCSLSNTQIIMYEDVSRILAATETPEKSEAKRPNAFQTLTYLRKLCDHPRLVFTDKERAHCAIKANLRKQGMTAEDIELSGKMIGLRDLLRECGIGSEAEPAMSAVSQHRALVFCQFRSTVDMIESYLRDGSLAEGVRWLRLDGSVPSNRRQAVADKFNADPSIDLLLLTTQVGGLGLNLTGADVVIFVDHDWNPAKDLQAMDRAHRLGQQRTVNVYRLITRGTLEEKIMRFQQFKTKTAEALVGEDNRSLLSMATDQLFDLLTLDEEGSSKFEEKITSKTRKESDPVSIEEEKLNLGELWDQSQYDEAFDVSSFLANLNR